jgi:hypothetical protein
MRTPTSAVSLYFLADPISDLVARLKKLASAASRKRKASSSLPLSSAR